MKKDYEGSVVVYVVGEEKSSPPIVATCTAYVVLFGVIPWVVILNVVEIGVLIKEFIPWLR